MYALPLSDSGELSDTRPSMTALLYSSSCAREEGGIAALIHLWLMVVMATCYAVFIVWRLRKKVLRIPERLRCFRWHVPSSTLSHVRCEPDYYLLPACR
jgi:hypothetical protein